MNYFKRVIFFALSMCTTFCFSQDLRNFEVLTITEADGLPSNEVYHAIQDHIGFIWFATDNGLCRFNGQDFKVFDSRHGMPSNSVFHLFPQPDSSIVGVCANNEFFRIKEESITTIISSDSIRKYMGSRTFPYSYYQDKNGNHHIGTRRGYFSFDLNNNLVKTDTVPREYNFVNFWETESGEIFCYSKESTEINNFIEIRQAGKSLGIFNEDRTPSRSIYASSNDDYVFIHRESSLFLIHKTTKKIRAIPSNGYCIGGNIQDTLLFVSLFNKGLRAYDISEGDFNLCYTLEPDLSVSSILKAKDGLYYLTTLEDGIRIINTRSAQKVYSSPADNNITAISTLNDGLIIGFEDGRVSLLKAGQTYKSRRKIFQLFPYKELIYVSTPHHFVINTETRRQHELFVYDDGRPPLTGKVMPFNDSVLVFIGENTIKFKNIKNSSFLFDEEYSLDQPSMTQIINDVLYISYQRGIRIIDPFASKQVHFPNTNHTILGFFLHKGDVYGVSQDFKIYAIEKDGNKSISIPMPEGVNGILGTTYSKEVLHVSTNKGVFSWKLDDLGHPTQMINFESIPLIRHLHCNDDTLYLATNKTIFKRSLTDLRIELPKVFISFVRIGEKESSNKTSFELSYSTKNIEFILDHISLSEPFHSYRYQLIGHQDKYFYTQENKITFSSLPPGDYVFKVSATSDGINYSEEHLIYIKIHPPYWKTWWFITLVAILGLSLVFFILRIFIKRLRNRMEIRQMISKLRSQALMAQLNPHLVFNVLNAIQGMVSEGKTEESNKYIARFSRFLRNTLRHSKQSSYAIDEEIKMINQYIELEQLRFLDSIKFNVVIDLIDKTTKVPPLITQPIVENAIKHGVMPSTGDTNKIELKLFERDQFLIIEIMDNGVGFSEETNFGDGMRITKERLKALSLKNELVVISRKNPTIVHLKILLG